MTRPDLAPDKHQRLHDGCVIPAHPLALTDDRRFDERSQRALTRYYLESGAGGLAVGVHTTQFAIRDHGLYRPVLELAIETAQREYAERRPIMVAGVIGPIDQAVREAQIARDLGYDMALVALDAYAGDPDHALLTHLAAVGEIIPLFGFYLQAAVGGRPINYATWRRIADLESLHAIKIAPFNRYMTLDVVRAVIDSDRCDEIALYTGNDDAIVADLVTPFRANRSGMAVEKRIAGGLLGHWAVWTSRAVEIHRQCAGARERIDPDLLATGMAITDMNAAVFDVRHNFAGCIPGINEILRRQRLLRTSHTLDPDEVLSPGQAQELDRVIASWPELTDDDRVREHLDRWLR